MIETGVVVAGAGPAGLTLACELALAGVDVVVLEKLARPVEQTKGGTLQPRTAELFDLRGMLDPLRAKATDREPIGGHFAGLPVPLDCAPWHTRHPHPISVPQWTIEEFLEEHAISLGAQVLRAREVTAVEQDEAGVTVTASGERVRAGYLVACDGGHSTVRKLLGLAFPGRPGTFVGTLADIRLTAKSALVPEKAGHFSTVTRRHGNYWTMLVPVHGDRYRLTFGDLRRQDLDRDAPVTEAEVTEVLHTVYGEETELGGIHSSSRFSDATRQLENYRHGRIFFAGDAAHIHPPFGGQGLNLGVQDAFNLGWKLGAVLRGDATEDLLDTYHDERHPPAARVLHHTAAQRALGPIAPDEDVQALRDIFSDLLRQPDANRYLAGLMSGLSLGYDLPGEHPLTGQRVPDVDLVTEAGPTRLSTLLHAGRPVLLDFTDEPADLPEWVEHVTAKSAEDLGAPRLLLRPDGYVAWAGSGPVVGGGTYKGTREQWPADRPVRQDRPARGRPRAGG